MPSKARLRLLANASPSSARDLASELSHAGLTVDLDSSKAPKPTLSSPCLLFFDHLTADVMEEVHEAGGWGSQHVLAVALPEASLENAHAWSLVRGGATDVLRWDYNHPPVREVAARIERWTEVDQMLRSDTVRQVLIGDSTNWLALLRQIVEVAAFTETSVLLTGESGTGKELAARVIHNLDRRSGKGSLVVVDCTTVVPTLSGSEFFGHERGAFTGAVTTRDGAFARADGGTLFLDEIGDLPLPLQAELLRVIQEGTYKRVGSDIWRDTQFRLVCATNRALPEAVERGEFRSDLYHRIAAWGCELPPLRQRREDIVPLALHFLGQMVPALGRPPFDPAVTEFIVGRDYPGNVRELKLLVARIAARHVGEGPITVGSLPSAERPRLGPEDSPWWQGPFEEAVKQAVSVGVGLREIGKVAQQTAIAAAMTAGHGNVRRASRMLGVTERALQLRRSAGGLRVQAGGRD